MHTRVKNPTVPSPTVPQANDLSLRRLNPPPPKKKKKIIYWHIMYGAYYIMILNYMCNNNNINAILYIMFTNYLCGYFWVLLDTQVYIENNQLQKIKLHSKLTEKYQQILQTSFSEWQLFFVYGNICCVNRIVYKAETFFTVC